MPDSAESVPVAGVDGTPGGWAVAVMDGSRLSIQKVSAFSSIFDGSINFKIVAVDVPIGLLDAYEVGGRLCDRAARVSNGVGSGPRDRHAKGALTRFWCNRFIVRRSVWPEADRYCHGRTFGVVQA